MPVTSLLGGTFAARSRNALVFFITPFEISPTRVYYRELSVRSLKKPDIRESEKEAKGRWTID